MKVVIPGGNGHLGKLLAAYLGNLGYKVVILSWKPQQDGPRSLLWDGVEVGDWARELEGAQAVINLAGRSVNCRYHAKNRREILASRVLSTRAIGRAIAGAHKPPVCWLQMSTATFYAHSFEQVNDEETGVLGDEAGRWGFSIRVATEWEREAKKWVRPETRQVLMRSAMVMSSSPGGPYRVLANLARLGFGGKQGDGKQYVSWLHELDFVRSVAWLISQPSIQGPINLASPHPLPNHEFMRILRRSLGKRWGIPAPAWLLEVGAIFLRTETELPLKSRRVISTRLANGGFTFRYPDWKSAAARLALDVTEGRRSGQD